MVGLSMGACQPEPVRTESNSQPETGPSAPTSAVGETEAVPETEADTEVPVAVDEGAAAEGEDEPGSPWPEAPEGYGRLAFTEPPPTEEQLTMNALAGYEVVAVYAKPSMQAKKIGFLRYGQRKRATQKVATGECSKGWYGLEGGGFACASKGLVVESKPPFMKYVPPPPNLDAPYPYEWAYVRKWNTPMWWRMPSDTELVAMKEQRAALEAERNAEAAPAEEPAPKPSGDPKPVVDPKPAADDGADLPAVEDDPKPVPTEDTGGEAPAPAPTPAPTPAPVSDEGGSPPEEEQPEPIKLPLNPGHPWLEKGFFISLAGTAREAGRVYWRTARGAFVRQSETFKYEAKDFEGVTLTDEVSLPIGFTDKKETKVYELTEDDKLKVVDRVDRRTFFDFEAEVDHAGKTYMRTTDGHLVRKEHVRMPELAALPKGLEPWDRWIDVSLSRQMMVAYEGTRPVYVTLVSTGKKGSEEEPFETPVGRWRIYSKQVTSNMDGTTATDGNYAIQDVPWVMYFEGSYALHGAFWHRSFGRVRSHGCVNLGPSDARWLFHWTTPFLPDGWHGVHATEESPGTTIVVHE